MTYKALEKQIMSLPNEAIQEVYHYVSYLAILYSEKKQEETNVTEQINRLLKDNPDVSGDISMENPASLESIRELTKNDTW